MLQNLKFKYINFKLQIPYISMMTNQFYMMEVDANIVEELITYLLERGVNMHNI